MGLSSDLYVINPEQRRTTGRKRKAGETACWLKANSGVKEDVREDWCSDAGDVLPCSIEGCP
jgi:hypothetical protein